VTRDELIALLQERRNNDVRVYVPCEVGGALVLPVSGVAYHEDTDFLAIETDEALADEVSFVDADDRRGFRVHVNGEPIGEEIFGWVGIDRVRRLVAVLANALGAEVAK
jgi:hypothetical protein